MESLFNDNHKIRIKENNRERINKGFHLKFSLYLCYQFIVKFFMSYFKVLKSCLEFKKITKNVGFLHLSEIKV